MTTPSIGNSPVSFARMTSSNPPYYIGTPPHAIILYADPSLPPPLPLQTVMVVPAGPNQYTPSASSAVVSVGASTFSQIVSWLLYTMLDVTIFYVDDGIPTGQKPIIGSTILPTVQQAAPQIIAQNVTRITRDIESGVLPELHEEIQVLREGIERILDRLPPSARPSEFATKVR